MTKSLFTRAQFTYSLDTIQKNLVIIDEDAGTSVTNDMENVLAFIDRRTGVDLSKVTIVYRDTEGVFDGVIASRIRSNFPTQYTVHFRSVGADNETDAIAFMKQNK